MRQLLLSILASLVLFSVQGCSGGGGSSDDISSGGDDTGSDGNTSTSKSLTVTTYNLGLLPQFVSLTNERVQPLAQTLSSFSSDVLGLQEVWRTRDRKSIV